MVSTGSTDGPRRLTLVAAYADNRVIGDRGRIPWHLSEDFAHFKATTMGGVLVMGRATYDSIGRPLPGRTTIVLTRDRGWSADGVLVAHSLDEALSLAAEQPRETFVVGGTQVYEQALPLATHQVLTEVDLSPEGDARYPVFDLDEWVETKREPRDGFRLGLVGATMTLGVSIDATSLDPPYEQIRAQLAAQVARGDLPPGTQLPTVRALAETLRIAPNTVARAYRELEHAGVVTTRGRAGTVVNGDLADRAAKEAATAYADAMRALGVGQDEALGLVRRAFDRPVSS